MVEKYRTNHIYQAPKESEEEYDEYQKCKKKFYKLFTAETMSECMRQDICLRIGYSARCEDTVFEKFINTPQYGLDILGKINNVFFKSYLFCAAVQLESFNGNNTMKEETINNLLTLLREASRRNIYDENCYILVLWLLSTKEWEKVIECIPKAHSAKRIMEEVGAYGQHFLDMYKCFKESVLNRIISNLVKAELASSGEGKYLHFLPFIFNKKLNFNDYISEYEMQQLDKKVYQDDTDRLVVELLKLCRGQESSNWDNLFELNVSPEIFYNWTVHVVYECDIPNADVLSVKLFYKLQEEKFEGAQELKNELFNYMLERGERERTLENRIEESVVY